MAGIKAMLQDMLSVGLRKMAVDLWEERFESLEKSLREWEQKTCGGYGSLDGKLGAAIKAEVGKVAVDLIANDPELKVMIRSMTQVAMKEMFESHNRPVDHVCDKGLRD